MKRSLFLSILIFLFSFNVFAYNDDPFGYSEDAPIYRDVKKTEHVFVGGGFLHLLDHSDRDTDSISKIGLNINLGFIFDLDDFTSLLFDFSYLYNGTEFDSVYISFIDLLVGVAFNIDTKFKIGILGGTTRVSYNNSSASESEWEGSIGWMIQYNVMRKFSVRFHHVFIFENMDKDYYYSNLYVSAGMEF
ncbi:hypothetical protein JXR93_14360 [bacterium]|nr:hypothetical protein [bacterium]